MNYATKFAFHLSIILVISIIYGYPQITLAKPTVVADKKLGVEKVFVGSIKPTTMTFIGQNDFLILEK